MPPLKSILVTGATGNQGSGVITHCLRGNHDVYAYVRNPSSPTAITLKNLGAKLITGDFDNISALSTAVQNKDAVFHLPAQSGNYALDLQRTKNVINAARSSPSVKMMITSTAIKTGQHESFPGWGPEYPLYEYWNTKHETEESVRSAGFQYWTIIRPAHFLQKFTTDMSAQLYWPKFLEDFKLRVAFKETTKIPWIDARDVGIVVRAAIEDPEAFGGREIDLAVEALTIGETAGKLGRAIGRTVGVHYYSEEEEEKAPRVSASQHWANEVPGEDAAEAVKEFQGMTSVDEFFENNVLFGDENLKTKN